MFYLCSENKGADQLCGYRKADPRLCFRICKKQDAAHITSSPKGNDAHLRAIINL